MTIVYDSNVFHGQTLMLGNAIWRRNRIRGCRVIADALPADWDGNLVEDSRFEFIPGGVTPTEFANWIEPKAPDLAAALRAWVAGGGWKPPSVH